MTAEPDYILEVRGIDPNEADSAKSSATDQRRWIGVQFECCGIYARIYRSSDGHAYVGHCPKCLRKIHAAVGPGGTTERFFRAE